MTAPEPALLPADAAPRADRGGALPFSVVGAIFATLLVLGISLGFVIHRSYVGFERVAARHVPPDTTLVLRWDVEKVSLFEPTRRFLLPLLDYPNVTPAPAPKAGARLHAPVTRRDRFAELSGAMLGRDLREVVTLFGPGERDWAVVLAGSFGEGDLMAAAERTLADEGLTTRPLGPGRLAAPSGVALGRAPDGVVVIASSPERLESVLVRRDVVPEVPRLGAGALLLRKNQAGLPASVSGALASLGEVSEVTGAAEWGSPLSLELVVRFEGQPPADAQAKIRTLAARVFGPDLARLERTNAPISVQSAGNQALRIRILLDDVSLERLAKRAAETVSEAVGPRAGAGNGL
jgi:hypothetical protein